MIPKLSHSSRLARCLMSVCSQFVRRLTAYVSASIQFPSERTLSHKPIVEVMQSMNGSLLSVFFLDYSLHS